MGRMPMHCFRHYTWDGRISSAQGRFRSSFLRRSYVLSWLEEGDEILVKLSYIHIHSGEVVLDRQRGSKFKAPRNNPNKECGHCSTRFVSLWTPALTRGGTSVPRFQR